jgi:hypothetical protein
MRQIWLFGERGEWLQKNHLAYMEGNMMKILGISYTSLLKIAPVTPLHQLSFFCSLNTSGKNPLPPETNPVMSHYYHHSNRQQKLADAHIFDQLREEEKKQFHRKGRKRTAYEKNTSAAISLPYASDVIGSKYGNQTAILDLIEDQVIEHANRRVDLYFYTLIAYFNLGIHVARGRTVLQHGKGRTTKTNGGITQACHSSILPALVDETIYQNQWNKEKKKGVLHGTHFSESLSSTVELPPFINDFDGVLERMCRSKSEHILAAVSLGQYNPVEGLTHFLLMMRDTLDELREKSNQKKPTILSTQSLMRHHNLNRKLIDLTIQGTLSTTFCAETERVLEAYVHLILGVKSKELLLCEEEEGQKEVLYLNKIRGIQNEILNSKSEHSTHLA